MKKTMLPLILIIIGLIIIILSYFGPWYTLSINYTLLGMQANYNQQIYLSSIELSGNAVGFDFTQTILLDAMEIEGISKDYIDFLQNVKTLTLISIITCILGFIGIAATLFNFGEKIHMKKIGIIFGIITFCLTILTIIYFVIGWTNIEITLQQNINNFFEKIGIINPYDTHLGFWYTNVKNGNTFSIGPGYAWYLMIITGVLSWLSAFFINRHPHE